MVLRDGNSSVVHRAVGGAGADKGARTKSSAHAHKILCGVRAHDELMHAPSWA